jgi:hypothetical protein
MTISITTFCRYAECGVLLTVMLNVIFLSAVMLSVVAPGKMIKQMAACFKLYAHFTPFCAKLERLSQGANLAAAC